MSTIGFDYAGHARTLAARHAATRRPLLSQPGPVTTPDGVARKIADDMLDIAAVKGSVDDADLVLRGWTADALARHGPAARDLANAARVREA
ncbi:hypothetical protein [Aureimonas sp. ME7]|uniref:hypothetical protein n=1 Tax=Aureimonas sp. ME7 TaxID=2744252 RepID=UPI0015F9089A|nr:hypothetical protein [Aureimonas sp. ME7]